MHLLVFYTVDCHNCKVDNLIYDTTEQLAMVNRTISSAFAEAQHNPLLYVELETTLLEALNYMINTIAELASLLVENGIDVPAHIQHDTIPQGE